MTIKPSLLGPGQAAVRIAGCPGVSGGNLGLGGLVGP